MRRWLPTRAQPPHRTCYNAQCVADVLDYLEDLVRERDAAEGDAARLRSTLDELVVCCASRRLTCSHLFYAWSHAWQGAAAQA